MSDLPYQPAIVGLLLGAPLLTCLGVLADGKRSQRYAGVVTSFITFIGLIISLFCALSITSYGVQLPWISIGGYTLSIDFTLDKLTALMLPLVHFIALLVQIYSTQYMKGDPAIHRYFAFIQLFLFSMIGIILSGNLIVMYIFWELVGLSSYLLIGFWHQKPRTVWAAQKAFILNRIGDAAFLSGILMLLYYTGTTSFNDLPTALATISVEKLTIIGVLLFGGCAGKSAQFPLSAWLPDAMEGPTPVSALIHAATMVAAGIFLLARIAFLLTPHAELIIAVLGIITMVDGALKALTAWDIKKVLAFSTQSQLGLMVFAVGMGSWQFAIFHLLTHAFFKAGLFLSAGSVIHAITPSHTPHKEFDPQDMRNMGGLRKVLPITYVCYLICAAALAGLPFLSGFLSKDAIFVQALSRAEEWGIVAYIGLFIAVSAASLTAFYMTRQVWLIFGGEARYTVEPTVHPHESPMEMKIPMLLLTGLSAFIWFSWLPHDAASGWLVKYLEVPETSHSLLVPILSVLATGTGIGLAWKRIQSGDQFLSNSSTPVKQDSGWFLRDYHDATRGTDFFLVPFQHIGERLQVLETTVVDAAVNALGKGMIAISRVTNFVDRYIVDGAVQLVTGIATSLGAVVRSIQNGRIQSYYIATFVSLILLFIWLVSTR